MGEMCEELVSRPPLVKFWTSESVRTVSETRGESVGSGTRRAQGKQGRNQERPMEAKTQGG